FGDLDTSRSPVWSPMIASADVTAMRSGDVGIVLAESDFGMNGAAPGRGRSLPERPPIPNGVCQWWLGCGRHGGIARPLRRLTYGRRPTGRVDTKMLSNGDGGHHRFWHTVLARHPRRNYTVRGGGR